MLDHPLMTTAELEERLDDPRLRLFDCSVILQVKEGGGYRSESGRDQWLAEHITGAGFVDLMQTLSDADQAVPFQMPTDEQFKRALSDYGVGSDHFVVAYNRGPAWWAMRFWWMLRSFGFDQAAVLDGGLDKWKAEGRALESGEVGYPKADFLLGSRRDIFVNVPEVLEAIDDEQTMLINALTEATHRGDPGPYARPGRIASSVNVPAPGLFEADQTLNLTEETREKFVKCGAFDANVVVNYCGGGISACADAFALHLFGHPNVQIYDGSLSEWARDPSLPMETG